MKTSKPITFTMVHLVLIVTLLALTSTYAHSYWTLNYSEIAFDGSVNITTALQGDISTGGGYFLEAYADTLLLMKKLELPGTDAIKDDTLPLLANQVLYHLEQSRAAYLYLKKTTAGLPYNPAVQEALARFDYDAFQKTETLDQGIFAEAKNYLSNGRIREIYDEIIIRHDILIPLLKQIKSDIDSGVFPSLKVVWQANQVFSRTLLYGQYVAQVFAAIK